MKSKNSLTPFGIAVRRYRLEAGNKKLKDMAEKTGYSIALHSAVEVGDKNPKEELVRKSIEYFAQFNIDASNLTELAKSSTVIKKRLWDGYTQEDYELATVLAKEIHEMEQDDSKLMTKLVKEISGMEQEKKKRIWEVINDD